MVNECEDCGSEFTTTRDLNQHVSSHGLGKIHECEDYGREFTTTSNLKQHVSSHGLGKIHECEDCGRAFTNRDSVILQNGQMKPRKNCSVEAKKMGKIGQNVQLKGLNCLLIQKMRSKMFGRGPLNCAGLREKGRVS